MEAREIKEIAQKEFQDYVWHIKNLEIFDTPLSVNDFYRATLYDYDLTSYRLKKAPQSWQYVWIAASEGAENENN